MKFSGQLTTVGACWGTTTMAGIFFSGLAAGFGAGLVDLMFQTILCGWIHIG